MPAVLFAGLWALARRPVALVTAGLWAAYVPYEFAMKWRILCSGECNIRVDLLLIYPLLLVLSVVALVTGARAVLRRRRPAGHA